MNNPDIETMCDQTVDQVKRHSSVRVYIRGYQRKEWCQTKPCTDFDITYEGLFESFERASYQVRGRPFQPLRSENVYEDDKVIRDSLLEFCHERSSQRTIQIESVVPDLDIPAIDQQIRALISSDGYTGKVAISFDGLSYVDTVTIEGSLKLKQSKQAHDVSNVRSLSIGHALSTLYSYCVSLLWSRSPDLRIIWRPIPSQRHSKTTAILNLHISGIGSAAARGFHGSLGGFAEHSFHRDPAPYYRTTREWEEVGIDGKIFKRSEGVCMAWPDR